MGVGHEPMAGGPLSVPVPVVDVRDVRMIVHEPRVAVSVRVRLAGRIVGAVLVLVVLVVHVHVRVLHLHVHVRVRVTLAQEEGDARGHDEHHHDVEHAERLAEQRGRRERPDEGRGREVRRLARSPTGAGPERP